MAIYVDEMARHTGVGIIDFVKADGSPGSPYSPLTSGRLIQVKVHVGGDAVTSLVELVTVKLESSKWAVPLHITVNGANIRTAPAFPIPTGIQNCDLPVQTGIDIQVKVLHVTGATPVTPQIQVLGVFEGPLAG